MQAESNAQGWRKIAVQSWQVMTLGLLLSVVSFPSLAAESLEAELTSLEAQSVTGDWQATEERLDALAPQLAEADPALQVRAGLIRARNAAIGGNEDRGLAMLEELLEQAPTDALRLDVHSLTANLAMNIGRYAKAFEHLGHGLDLLDVVDDPAPRARIYGHAAMIYTRMGEYEQATRFGDQAVAMARETGNRRELCVELERLSNAETETRGWIARHATISDAERTCEAANDELFGAAMIRKRGLLYRDRGEWAQALVVLAQAREAIGELGFARGMIVVDLDRAEMLIEMGELEKAEGLLDGTIETLEARGDLMDLERALIAAAELAEARRDHESAAQYYRRAREIRIEWEERERDLRRTYLRTAFETEIQRQELELLREQARVADLEATTQRQRRLFMGLGYAATAVVSVMLFVLLMRSSRERRHFRRLSERDSLTGLLNHSHFFACAQQALDEARADEQGFVLVLADIDHFKQFNDTHGHAAGDGALRKVAALFHRVFGEDAVIGRVGGEEFALALPAWNREGTLARIHRFRRKLEPLSYDGQRLQITLSFGLVEAGEDLSVRAMHRLADEALYEAKGAGRDRVVEADHERLDPVDQ
ncbi:diguanylate cyclase (GGDEF)-like protein [Natronospira proteinivora]|uniref:diguanylate cyclase n=1 Tax=Natronospira proteinivora TaxID=1807133 RepID=A0ABT1G952_9GAMM|nr:GGDEF domain-containing protein [Natronospira proteinivora]MCP1727843.1 diguanylate cyclase (GGDEF)-like protein [Natronospira proteinivora]